jgi:hypothetical protein
MGKEELSREELFALVWEKPTVEVAKELGVSENNAPQGIERSRIRRCSSF